MALAAAHDDLVAFLDVYLFQRSSWAQVHRRCLAIFQLDFDRCERLRSAVRLVRFEVTDGTLTFDDHSIDPAAHFAITELQGALTNLSTQPGKDGRVAITASVIGSQPATLAGEANLLGPDFLSGSDLSFTIRGTQLEPLQPYAEHFLGYKIDRGRMQGDFNYTLRKGALDGKNHVVLSNFSLGDPVPSPDALAMPIKLALAVLRNGQGDVVLDILVSGSLDSPNFSFDKTIREAIGNVFSRVASTPFSFLGSLFGGNDADISQAQFPPGRSDFDDATTRKLDVLAKALQDRPGLKLVIHPQQSSEADRPVMGSRSQRPPHLREGWRSKLQQSAMRTCDSKLIDSMPIDQTDADQLATDRAERARDHLVNSGVARSRVVIAPRADEASGSGQPTQLRFELDTHDGDPARTKMAGEKSEAKQQASTRSPPTAAADRDVPGK